MGSPGNVVRSEKERASISCASLRYAVHQSGHILYGLNRENTQLFDGFTQTAHAHTQTCAARWGAEAYSPVFAATHMNMKGTRAAVNTTDAVPGR